MKYAAITMVYNEGARLRLWRSYYGKLFGSQNIYVVDHGSTDGSTNELEFNRIMLPRGVLDEYQRARFISSLHASLLAYYDIVIYTDCDEFIIPRPEVYKDLNEYLDRCSFEYSTTVGLNVIHDGENDGPIDWGGNILKQRRFSVFMSSMCKTLVSRRPINWAPGFHGSNYFPRIDRDLFLFHLKASDLTTHLARQEITRNLAWKDQSLGGHQRTSDDAVRRRHQHLSSLPKDPGFEFERYIREFADNVALTKSGLYLPQKSIEGREAKLIPEAFRSIL